MIMNINISNGLNKNSIEEIIGWYGMAAILLAYALVSFSFLSASNIIYQLLNFTGAGGGSLHFAQKKSLSARSA